MAMEGALRGLFLVDDRLIILFESNKFEKPLPILLYGIFLVLFGSFALLLEWVMWRSIDNRLFLMFTLISFAVPAFAAFFMGIKRLDLFNNLYTADRDQNNYVSQ
jgi:glucan phosphoethanolaminetransferase (alkaline phosphatase superfamily)